MSIQARQCYFYLLHPLSAKVAATIACFSRSLWARGKTIWNWQGENNKESKNKHDVSGLLNVNGAQVSNLFYLFLNYVEDAIKTYITVMSDR